MAVSAIPHPLTIAHDLPTARREVTGRRLEPKTSTHRGRGRRVVDPARGPGVQDFCLQFEASSGSFFSVITGHLGDSSALRAVKSFQSSGKLSSWKIASTGHSGTHASQSIHSSGWI